VYGGVGIFLFFNIVYRSEKLKRYIDRQYPEEGKYIRSREWQGYPWAKWGKVMRELIKKQRGSDTELAHLAKKLNRSSTLIVAWFVLFLLMFAVFFIYDHLSTPAE